MVNNPPEIQETRVRSLGWEDPLEKGMATHSSVLAWRIPWTEEPGGYSPWGRKESNMTERLLLSNLECHVGPSEWLRFLLWNLCSGFGMEKGWEGRELPSRILTRVLLPSRRSEPVSQL